MTYSARNAPIVLDLPNDGSTENVHIGADVYDDFTYTVLITDVYGDVTATNNFPSQDFYNTDYGQLTSYSNGSAFTIKFYEGTGTYNGVTSPRTSRNYEQLFMLYRDDRGGPLVPPFNPIAAVADSYATTQDTPLTITAAAGLLANDTDADGNPLTAVLAGNPAPKRREHRHGRPGVVTTVSTDLRGTTSGSNMSWRS